MLPVSLDPASRSPQVPRRPSSKGSTELLSHKISSRLARDNGPRIGPYALGKTLGVGSTGRVKLGTHLETGQKVAIKIIPKESLASSSTESVASDSQTETKVNNKLNEKVEREITIMKLIQHPNVMQLYDVYETDKELYLILEHIEGGELFDYLVSRGRLPENEALDFFQQITFAVDFCHRHLICHRDLKPENLLLSKDMTVKVADFGMASLQVTGKMLETSCGSPHYASPEIIRGIKYDGAPADVWSCGIILFALLTGNLPFDDENIRRLLSKVKVGAYVIPDYVSPEARDLITKMLVVDPEERISMNAVFQHRWFTTAQPRNPESFKYLSDDVTDHINENADKSEISKFRPLIIGINDPDSLDLDVVSSLGFLGWTGNEKGLIQALLSPEKNMEKVFYNLLCRRKWESFENYGSENFSAWDVAGGPKRRIGSMSMASLDSGDSGSPCSPSMSRLDIYKSELNLVRRTSSSSNDSLAESGNQPEKLDDLPSYSSAKLSAKPTAYPSESNGRPHSPLGVSMNALGETLNFRRPSGQAGKMKSISGGIDSATTPTKPIPVLKTPTSDPVKLERKPTPPESESPTARRKASLYDDGTPNVTPPKKRWFKRFQYTPPEISLISTNDFLPTAEAALLRLNDLHVKHQTDNFGSWKCKYDSQNEQIVPVSPSHNNFVANFTRKISLSLKGPESAVSPAGTLVNVQKASTPQTVKFKMEVRTSSEQSGGCRIIFIHQQGSYSLLQSIVEKFKSAWPLGQISKKEGV